MATVIAFIVHHWYLWLLCTIGFLACTLYTAFVGLELAKDSVVPLLESPSENWRAALAQFRRSAWKCFLFLLTTLFFSIVFIASIIAGIAEYMQH